jgi:hypothetical protein
MTPATPLEAGTVLPSLTVGPISRTTLRGASIRDVPDAQRQDRQRRRRVGGSGRRRARCRVRSGGGLVRRSLGARDDDQRHPLAPDRAGRVGLVEKIKAIAA